MNVIPGHFIELGAVPLDEFGLFVRARNRDLHGTVSKSQDQGMKQKVSSIASTKAKPLANLQYLVSTRLERRGERDRGSNIAGAAPAQNRDVQRPLERRVAVACAR